MTSLSMFLLLPKTNNQCFSDICSALLAWTCDVKMAVKLFVLNLGGCLWAPTLKNRISFDSEVTSSVNP